MLGHIAPVSNALPVGAPGLTHCDFDWVAQGRLVGGLRLDGGAADTARPGGHSCASARGGLGWARIGEQPADRPERRIRAAVADDLHQRLVAYLYRLAAYVPGHLFAG